MNYLDNKYPSARLIVFISLSFFILMSMGCSLFSANYWVHRLDDEAAVQESESTPTAGADSESANEPNFGSTCLNAPGTEPCSIDACVVYKGQYTVKNVVTNELFGKANPNDYQCCADFEFANNSGTALMGFVHFVTEYTDNWSFELFPIENSERPGNCSNFFTSKDGKETYNPGVKEIVVLYANPHCDWIQWDEPGLAQYRVPVEPGCYSN